MGRGDDECFVSNLGFLLAFPLREALPPILVSFLPTPRVQGASFSSQHPSSLAGAWRAQVRSAHRPHLIQAPPSLLRGRGRWRAPSGNPSPGPAGQDGLTTEPTSSQEQAPGWCFMAHVKAPLAWLIQPLIQSGTSQEVLRIRDD